MLFHDNLIIRLFLVYRLKETLHFKVPVKCAYLKGLSKYRRMAFFFLRYLFSFQRY